MQTTYFRKGFGLKDAVEGQLTEDYHSAVVAALRSNDFRLTVGPLTLRLAREFGFCYGVDRAVEYAYETRVKFPDRRLFLIGEIIHNPHVNQKLCEMGITILQHHGPDRVFDFSGVQTDDVVILPAFGVAIGDFQRLRELGCVLVDTTCGSVLNVWKRVENYAYDGFTAVIHGKWWHEETKATASQVAKYPDGRSIVVFDMNEARLVMDYIERGGDVALLWDKFAKAVSPGFDFERDLIRVGLANQTTMLSTESLAIAAEFGKAMARRYGEAALPQHFRSFDTICSATQERQDAVVALLGESIDVMLVVGGYNSSNTCHLAALATSKGIRTYHIEDAQCIDTESGTIRHQPVGTRQEKAEPGWLDGARAIGMTAGASTPNNKIGETVERICRVAGVDLEAVVKLSSAERAGSA